MIGKFHYLNGKWVKPEDLKLSIFDLSVLRGYGCFDFLRTYNNQPFKLKEHLERFFNSAKLLDLKVPLNLKQIEALIFQGIKKNKFKETAIKIILTGGVSKDGLTIGKPSLIIQFSEAPVYPKSFYQKGVKVITFNGIRIFPNIKSLNYLQGINVLNKVKKEGVHEALYTDGKKIYEGVTSNFFAVIKDKIITPKENILPGITRQVVLELAKKLKIKTEEKDIYLKDIQNFDSAFITSSNRGIMPVVQINNFVLNRGKISELVRTLMIEFENFVYKQ